MPRNIFTSLLKREWRLLFAGRAQLLTLAAYPLLLLLVGALALDLPQQGQAVRLALPLIAFVLLPLSLVGSAWQADRQSGALIQLRHILLSTVWARYAAMLFGIMLPLTVLLLAVAALLLDIDAVPLVLPLLLALPSLTGLLLLVAALLPAGESQHALPALLLLPLLVPAVVLLVLAATGPAGLNQAATYWLAALAALSLGLLPPAIAAALRHKLAS